MPSKLIEDMAESDSPAERLREAMDALENIANDGGQSGGCLAERAERAIAALSPRPEAPGSLTEYLRMSDADKMKALKAPPSAPESLIGGKAVAGQSVICPSCNKQVVREGLCMSCYEHKSSAPAKCECGDYPPMLDGDNNCQRCGKPSAPAGECLSTTMQSGREEVLGNDSRHPGSTPGSGKPSAPAKKGDANAL